MKTHYRIAIMTFSLALLAVGLLRSTPGVDAAATGQIVGTVKLDGQAPHMKGIDMSKDPYCAKATASAPAHGEAVVVGANGGLQNVVLYISEGYSGALTQTTTEPVFDQKNCVYSPHVLAVAVGQTFKVVTSDQTGHNVHPNPNPMTGNVPFNQSQPPGAAPFEKSWKAAEFIPVQCNIHPWMHAWFAVVKGPYATTDENGNYTINNVPPGSYTVTAWQETYGTQTQKVTVAAGKPAATDFSFKAK